MRSSPSKFRSTLANCSLGNKRKEIKMETLVRENSTENRTNGSQLAERFVAPVATVTENADGYILEVEMPGVNKEGLEMWVENNELTVSGRRSAPAVAGTVIHRESRPENFRRTFELDPSIDAT